jgi:hypothetical protein
VSVERAHTFGDDSGLFGVVTMPETAKPDAPAVVLLNAGLVHRVGPFRMHVELARRLAKSGFLVLRVDQSALGDSLPRRGGLSYEDRSVLDAKQAMDFLEQRYEARRFVVGGLCAGAMNAHRVAVADERVVGGCLLDGYAYRTPAFWRHRIVTAAAEPKMWPAAIRRAKQLFSGKAWDRTENAPDSVRAANAAGADGPGDDAAEIFAQDWPPREDVRVELERTLARGTKLLFVYTGGWSDYVHPSQFDEMFPNLSRRDQVTVRFFPDADHTYLLHAHRASMFAEVESFLARMV